MFGCHSRDRWFFPTQQLTEARNRILYLVESLAPGGHIASVDGGGRSTLLSLLRQDLRRMGCAVISASLLAANAESVTQQLACGLPVSSDNASTVAGRLLQIRDELLSRAACGRHVAILLDDIHRGTDDALSALEFLHAVAESSNGLVCLVTAGDSRRSCPLSRRSPLKIALNPLDAEEANSFLQARLAALGIATDRMSSSAIRTLVEGTQGLPRRLLHVGDLIAAVCAADDSVDVRTPETAAEIVSAGLSRAA